jgi:hypothetical protein
VTKQKQKYQPKKMKMNKTSKTLLALLATGLLSCGLFSQNALAIDGTIAFSGSASANHKSTDGTTTKITFASNWVVFPGGDGDYATVAPFTPVTFTSFSFMNDDANGVAPPATLVAPVAPLWTFTFGGNTYSFDLTALTSGAVTTNASGSLTSMAFTGTGTAHINGASSPATWSLQGSGRNFLFTFSSSTTTAAGVPDGGATVALLGMGLVGIAALRRKLNAV